MKQNEKLLYFRTKLIYIFLESQKNKQGDMTFLTVKIGNKETDKFCFVFLHNATDLIDRHFSKILGLLKIARYLYFRKPAVCCDSKVAVLYQRHKLELTEANLSLLKM